MRLARQIAGNAAPLPVAHRLPVGRPVPSRPPVVSLPAPPQRRAGGPPAVPSPLRGRLSRSPRQRRPVAPGERSLASPRAVSRRAAVDGAPPAEAGGRSVATTSASPSGPRETLRAGERRARAAAGHEARRRWVDEREASVERTHLCASASRHGGEKGTRSPGGGSMVGRRRGARRQSCCLGEGCVCALCAGFVCHCVSLLLLALAGWVQF